ncbi:MAG: hypothetical protein J0I20_02980 [Chloroflexi bacterium]|nr:hypothetical protein [Chloroflexota bacterium]OJV89273.1 MAG: hypothetical protein BGO39_35365 [Chloroflexi bacterium 54-19]
MPSKILTTTVEKPALSPALEATGKRVLFYVAGLMIFILALLLGAGADYFFTYHSHLVYWLSGHSQVYVTDPDGLYNPPWLLWLLTPFTFLPQAWELPLFQLALAFSMVAILDLITANLSGYTKLLSMLLGLVNFIVFDLVNRGQIDTLPLFGAVLFLVGRQHWLKAGLGYTLLAIKPPNTLPLMAFFFVRDWTTKSPREALKGLIIPTEVLALSFLIHGWWPVYLYQAALQKPPYDTWRTTIWRAADVLQLGPVIPSIFCLVVLGATGWFWRYADNQTKKIALLVPATFLVTPYALSYHYVLVLALVLPSLLAWKKWVGVGLYLLTFLPVVRIFLGTEHAYIDILFILGCYVAVAAWLRATSPTRTKISEVVAVPLPEELAQIK